MILLILSSFFIDVHSFAENKSAETVVVEFYKSYFNYSHSAKSQKPPELPFSINLQKLINENQKACDLYEPGICGWDAEYDVYTNAQESDENLTFENSNFISSALQENKIRVTFNLFPGAPDPYYDRVITFQMILENGNYVVDDIFYGSEMKSTVESIKGAIEYIKMYPNPDSKYCSNIGKRNRIQPKECRQ